MNWRYPLITSISIIINSISICDAISWPVNPADMKGIMSLYGDYRSRDIGNGFHSGIDITHNKPDESSDDCSIPAFSAAESWLTAFLASYDPRTMQVTSLHGMVMRDTWSWPWSPRYFVYEHMKGIDPSRFWVPFVFENTPLGYIGEKNDGEYGNSSPHLHFAIVGGDIDKTAMTYQGETIEVVTAWLPTFPLENPLNALPGADLIDTENPIYMKNESNGFYLDVTADVSLAAENRYSKGYVNKNNCPWEVRGKIDIITRINDYMDVVGLFQSHQQIIEIIPGIYQLKYEIMEVSGSEKWIIKADDPGNYASSFKDMLPGGENPNDRALKAVALHPSRHFGYEQIEEESNYNYYVVTNTDQPSPSSPFEISQNGCWDTSALDEGVYTIRVTAYDHANNSAYSDIQVQVKHADIYVDCKTKRFPADGTAEKPFQTISEGIEAASPGQKIFIAPGIYHQNENFPILIDKEGVSVEGSGFETTIVQGDYTNVVILIKDCDVSISDLTITGGGDSGGAYLGALEVDGHEISTKATIRDCKISENDSISGIELWSTSPDSSIENCIIENNNTCGIYLYHAHNRAYIRNCTIINNGIAGIAPEFDSWVSISDCILIGHDDAAIRAAYGSHTWNNNATYFASPTFYMEIGTNDESLGVVYNENVPFESDGLLRNRYINQASNCVDHGSYSCSGSEEICHMTTRLDNAPFPSGLYDINNIDIGAHYHPLCLTPTPQSTPIISDPIPCSSVEPGAGWISFDYEYYETDGMTAKIEVIDGDLNTNPYTYQTIEVTVTSETDTSGISFILREESANASKFTSTSNGQDLEFSLGTSVNYQSIQVSDSDTVTVTYYDSSEAQDRTDTTIWYQVAQPTNTSTPTPTGTWYTNTPTMTRTPTSTPTGTWSTNTPTSTPTSTITPGGPTFTPTNTFTPTPTPGPWTETDAWGYTGTTVTSFTWVDATTGTDLNITEDNGYATVSLPFNFAYYGNTYSSVHVSANGYLTFGDHPQEFENDYMPRDLNPNDVIAPFFDDLDPADSGRVYYLNAGSSVTFEWDLVRNNWSWTDSYTFEVTLYNDGQIKFQYYVMSGIYASGYSASVGIENAGGTIGLRYRNSYAAGEVMDSLAVLFTPPSTTPTPTPTPQILQYEMIETVENDGEGWGATGLWHVVDTNSANQCAKAHGGTKSFWYGLDSTCDYNTDTMNSGEITSPPIYLAENISFTFWSWEEVEPYSYFSVADNRLVFISEDNGQNWDLVYFHEPNTSGWELQTVDIGWWRYKTVRIKFVFDTMNEERNNYQGWYVDDIIIDSAVPPPLPALNWQAVAICLTCFTGLLSLHQRKNLKRAYRKKSVASVTQKGLGKS